MMIFIVLLSCSQTVYNSIKLFARKIRRQLPPGALKNACNAAELAAIQTHRYLLSCQWSVPRMTAESHVLFPHGRKEELPHLFPPVRTALEITADFTIGENKHAAACPA